MDQNELDLENDILTNLPVDENISEISRELEEDDKIHSLDRDLEVKIESEKSLILDESQALADKESKMAEETVAISKFAEEFVEPILKEVIARHKSEIEEEGSEVPSETNADKKSDKSSSDDGFEYVKGDEVIEEMHKEIGNRASEGEELKRELEDLVFKEEMHLENVEKDVTPEMTYEYESGNDGGLENETREMLEDVEAIIKDEVSINDNAEVTSNIKHEEIDNDLVNEEEAVLKSMDTFLDNALPSETSESEHFQETSFSTPIEITTEKEIREEILSHIVDHDIQGKCKDLISWNHPVASALAFSIIMFIELGLLMGHSIISLLAYSGLLLMSVSFAYKIAVYFRLINTQSSMNYVMPFNKEDVEYCVDVTLNWVEYIHKEIKSIAYVESLTKNIKVFIMFWILTYIGHMFNLQSLIFIGSLLLFSLPLMYGRFHTEIDGVYESGRASICGSLNRIKSKCQSMIGGGR